MMLPLSCSMLKTMPALFESLAQLQYANSW